MMAERESAQLDHVLYDDTIESCWCLIHLHIYLSNNVTRIVLKHLKLNFGTTTS